MLTGFVTGVIVTVVFLFFTDTGKKIQERIKG